MNYDVAAAAAAVVLFGSIDRLAELSWLLQNLAFLGDSTSSVDLTCSWLQNKLIHQRRNRINPEGFDFNYFLGLNTRMALNNLILIEICQNRDKNAEKIKVKFVLYRLH